LLSGCIDASYMKIFGRKAQKVSLDKRLPRDNYRYVDYALSEADKTKELPKVYTEDHHQFNDIFDDQKDIYPDRLNEYGTLSDRISSGDIEDRFADFSDQQIEKLPNVVPPKKTIEKEAEIKENPLPEEDIKITNHDEKENTKKDVKVVDNTNQNDNKTINNRNATQQHAKDPTKHETVNSLNHPKETADSSKKVDNSAIAKHPSSENHGKTSKQAPEVTKHAATNDASHAKDKKAPAVVKKPSVKSPHAPSHHDTHNTKLNLNEVEQSSKALEQNTMIKNNNYDVTTKTKKGEFVVEDNLEIRKRNHLREVPSTLDNEGDIQIIEGNRVYR
jgi:hypothetical protein